MRNKLTTLYSGAMLLVVLLVGGGLPSYAQQKLEQLGQGSSDAWLSLIDAGKYADSWQESS